MNNLFSIYFPKLLGMLFSIFLATHCVLAQNVFIYTKKIDDKTIYEISNFTVSQNIVVQNNKILCDSLTGYKNWLNSFHSKQATIVTDADFQIDFMWTDWLAPKKINNADNQVFFNKNDFFIEKIEKNNVTDNKAEIAFVLKSKEIPLKVKITYQIESGKFYTKRKVSVCDTAFDVHFLQKIYARKGYLSGFIPKSKVEATGMRMESSDNFQELVKAENENIISLNIIKKGDFGQPVAFTYSTISSFLGLEYPASHNFIRSLSSNIIELICSQDFGQKISNSWTESEWVVQAFVPNLYAKDWFFDYLNDIRVAPAIPYTLYNSWYDLRSPQYPKVKANNIMNEKNVGGIIDLFKKNMIDKYGIKLDAFVLDDGWDVYESDWELRKETFPNGLKPVADKLKLMGTDLGIWFGPTGGYSFRMKRVDWMKKHGYEVVGKGRNYAMLCLAGKNYSNLFRKRVTEMVKNHNVAYFKWDGIQFSCNEPDHGHSTDIYSRRAVLESLIDKCNTVRKENPKTYLNITSGTWLSPWFVKYANQIWMDGADYGYADVPTISERDAAITYRDFVLYDDFTNKDLWFPISNLMTHGIIKGNLEPLGGDYDPIDKFTDDVTLYFARGVTMYELYISPDLLNDAEWKAIGKSIAWAKDRVKTLSKTYMIGGEPTLRETYGYVHFDGNKGIIAARNPFINQGKLRVTLEPSKGMNPEANNLVLERVYPTRWISPVLYSAGATIDLTLDGYETAVYEVYPLNEATQPIVAGVNFSSQIQNDATIQFLYYGNTKDAKFLNPEIIKSISKNGKTISYSDFNFDVSTVINPIKNQNITFQAKTLSIETEIDATVNKSLISVLLKPKVIDSKTDFPEFIVKIDGKEAKVLVQKQKGMWAWYSVELTNGKHKIEFLPKDNKTKWEGSANVLAFCEQKEVLNQITIETKNKIQQNAMLPLPFENGIFKKNILLGNINVEF